MRQQIARTLEYSYPNLAYDANNDGTVTIVVPFRHGYNAYKIYRQLTLYGFNCRWINQQRITVLSNLNEGK